MLIRISLPFIISYLFLFSATVLAQNSDLTLNTVVIDAGHGGKDPGTLVGSLLEKNIVLDVALKVGKYINHEYPGVKVIYTRDKDIFVPLDERATIANKSKADLFISIHVNYYQSESTYGAETYILGNHRSEDNLKVEQMENSVILLEDNYNTKYEGYDPNSAESNIMFESIQNNFLEQSLFFAGKVQNSFIENAKRKSKGVKQAGFLVLRKTVMPSVLIELGYISNVKEKEFLETTYGRDQLALAIAKAFSSYKQRADDRSNVSIAENTKLNIAPIEENDEKKIQSFEEKVNHGKWYAVQILASAKELDKEKINLSPDSFVLHLNENSWHKYYTGFTQVYDDAIANQKKLNSKFQGAFLVVFNNGNKEKFNKF